MPTIETTISVASGGDVLTLGDLRALVKAAYGLDDATPALGEGSYDTLIVAPALVALSVSTHPKLLGCCMCGCGAPATRMDSSRRAYCDEHAPEVEA